MNINTIIIDCLDDIVGEGNVAPDKYTGSSQTYITFNYAIQSGTNFADDAPQNEIATMQIHLFTPNNPKSYESQIRKALFNTGFTYPEVAMEQYEDDTGLYHITFECEYDGEPDL